MEKTQNLPEVRGPSSLIEMALSKGADDKALEKLEKVLELQERWEANEAKKAYVKAMAEFKKDPPDIYKDKKNLQFKSRYSSIDALVNTTIPKLAQHGFSHNWLFSRTEDGKPQVTCVLTHELGHSEAVTFDAPPDTSGGNSKNPIQQIKSTHTYLKIATFEAVTGLVSREANLDDDGNGAGAEYISEEQVKSLQNEIDARKVETEMFFSYLSTNLKVEIKKLGDIPADKYDFALTAAKRKTKPEKSREPGQEG
jgi:hypothetical protein